MGSKSGLSVLGDGGDSVSMRNISGRQRRKEGADDRIHGDRLRVQFDDRKRGEERSDIAFALLLSFTRHLVRKQCGQDAMILAMYCAQDEQEASAEQIRRLMNAVLTEHDVHGFWPKGF